MQAPPAFVECNAELKALWMAHKMPEEEVEEVARELHEKVGVFDVPQYLAYFSMLPLVDFWKSKAEWQRRGSLLSYSRNSFVALARCRKRRKGPVKDHSGYESGQPGRS